MPITEELKNVKKFESVGFSHEQAEALAESLEQAQLNGQENLKECIRSEIGKFRAEVVNEFKNVHDQFGGVQNQFNDSNSQFGNIQSQFKMVHDQLGEMHNQYRDIQSQSETIHVQLGEIQNQFRDIHSQFKDVHQEINTSELRMKASQTDLLVKILAIVVGTVGTAVTILKLFP